jgi:hypothetical protein
MKRRLWLIFLMILGILVFATYKMHHNHEKTKKRHEKHAKNETWSRYLQKDLLLAKVMSSPPLWMQEGIQEDFNEFLQSGISENQVDATYTAIREKFTSSSYFVRYRIIDNELYRYFPPDVPISIVDSKTERALKTLLHFFSFHDMDFILCHADGVPCGNMNWGYYTSKKEWQAPILCSAKIKDFPYVILIPDWRSVSEWWYENIQEVMSMMKAIPWEKKQEKAIWRGGWTKGIRWNFCQFSLKHPNILDAKLNEELRKETIVKAGLWGCKISWKEFLSYKYLPTLDGVCCAAPAFQWRLLSNSVTFKEESAEIQWFYRGIRPNVHYISFSPDFKDFVEKIQWAKSHDGICRAIANRSTEFALQNLMFEDVYHYFYRVLKQYETLQKISLKNRKNEFRWVNIHYRERLGKEAKKSHMKGYIDFSTPIN